jgi:hypothetical protein
MAALPVSMFQNLYSSNYLKIVRKHKLNKRNVNVGIYLLRQFLFPILIKTGALKTYFTQILP